MAEHAGFLRRFVAYSIDITLMAALTGALTLIVAIGSAGLRPVPELVADLNATLIGPVTPFSFSHGFLTISGVAQVPTGHVAPFLIFNVLTWLHFTVEESRWGATFGKRLLHLRVTGEAGQPLTFARANARYWGKFISDETMCMGYLVILVAPRKQALHDLIARTVVWHTTIEWSD